MTHPTTTNTDLEKRYNKLDDMMKMYFRECAVIEAWNEQADKRNRQANRFNKNKKWYQRKKPTNFPHYHSTPIRMPQIFIIPPVFHPQYKQTKKLIEDFIKEWHL